MVVFFVLISDIEICYSLWSSHNFLLMLYIYVSVQFLSRIQKILE